MFSAFQPQLKSYLYRLMANRNDMEDLAQDVFILAFENLHSFKAEASLKTWVFTIATNEASRFLKKRKCWQPDTFERTKNLAHRDNEVMAAIDYASQHAPQRAFEIREHIDYCFTCVSKMLPIKQQIALILKDIYKNQIRERAIKTRRGKALHTARRMVKAIDPLLANGADLHEVFMRINHKVNSGSISKNDP
ncbi:MAG: RNA polymerase sigma factor [bacterium]